MDQRIKKFISAQTCATICYVNAEGNPSCFNCYFAFNSEEGLIYYKSSPNSQHSVNILSSPNIAGTILPDKLNTLQIKGVQLEGVSLPQDAQRIKTASTYYYKRHPIAISIPGEICTIQINRIKFTDNSFGFGKKFLWSRDGTSETLAPVV